MNKQTLHTVSSAGMVACFFLLLGVIGSVETGSISYTSAVIRSISVLVALAAAGIVNIKTAQDFGE